MGDKLASAHLDSGAANYTQTIRVGANVITADEPAAIGGGDTGPSPYGLLLSALAACTSITLKMYADRKGWDLGAVHIDLEIDRVGEIETITRTVKLGSTSLTPEQRARVAEIAEKTPVTKTLKRGTQITTTFV